MQAVMMSHPHFPIFMTALGCMPSLSNGATVRLWGSDDPNPVCDINVNSSQTRKSRLIGLAEKLHSHVDEYVATKLKEIYDIKQLAATQSKQKNRSVPGSDSSSQVYTPIVQEILVPFHQFILPSLILLLSQACIPYVF